MDNTDFHNKTDESLADGLLCKTELQQKSILNSIPDIVWLKDRDGRFVVVNEAFGRACGFKPEELIGKTDLDIWPRELAQRYSADDKEVMGSGKRKLIDEPLADKEGKIQWVETIKTAIYNDRGEVIGITGISRDITERKRYEERLREASAELGIRVKVRTAELSRINEELSSEIAESKKIGEYIIKDSEFRFRELFNHIGSGVAVYAVENNGMDFIFVDFNSAAERIEGAKRKDVIGKNVLDVFPSFKDSGLIDVFKKVWKTGEPVHHPAFFYKNKIVSGWRENYIYRLPRGEIVEVYDDVTKRKNNELKLIKSNEKLKELALIDSQTGLYNHRYLVEAVEVEFHRSRRYAHPLAVIMLDIDYFKSINDVYGFQFGDFVLKQFSRQLKMMVRKYDIVVRFGGEEFVVISPGLDKQEALILSQKILEALNLYNFGDKKHQVKLKISMGVVSYPKDHALKGMDLINLVEKILNKVKEAGGNRVYSLSDIRGEGDPAPNNHNKSLDIRLLKSKIDKLNKKANQSLTEAIFAFAKTIELKDHYTGEHVEITGHYTNLIANKLGLPKYETEFIHQASMLHDLGKIGISEKILLKKSKLTEKEFEEIKKHPQIGADILRPVHFLHDLIPLIFYHHERWDGLGYPGGIKGEEIPIGARIIALADVYQALTSDRPYRKAYSKAKALKIIKDGSGTQFDPKITNIFLKILQEEK